MPLASLIEIKNRDTTKHEFHVPLCDLLLDLLSKILAALTHLGIRKLLIRSLTIFSIWLCSPENYSGAKA